MIEHLPETLKDSDYFRTLYQAQGGELHKIKSAINSLGQQFNIESATWALEIYEKELGLDVDQNKPLDERRSNIRSKWRGTGKLDSELIKQVVDSFTNGGVDVKFDGQIVIQFNNVLGTPPNMSDVYEAMENIKPTHLPVIYEYLYLLIGDIDQRMTIKELESTKLDKFAF